MGLVAVTFKRKGRKGYAVKYRDPATHRLRTKQLPTKAAADDFRVRVRAAHQAADGLEVDVRFDEHAEKWLAATTTAVKRGTAILYEWAVRRYLVPAFGPHYLRDITAKMVRDHVVTLRASLAKGSAHNVVKVLHACLQAAVEDRILATNPATIRSRSKLMSLGNTAGEARGKVKALDAAQTSALLAAVPDRFALLFRVMVTTGLRPGEALALKPEDLDFAAGTIRLERALTRGRIEPCKTNAQGEWETVDMPAAIGAELREWTRAHRGEWIFGGREPWSHRELRAAFSTAARAAGIPPHFTPRHLRHTYATNQLIAGESVYYVSRQLRHADIRLTVSRYGSWLPAGNRAAADRLYERLIPVARMSPSR